jgi:hypothetical protein
MSIQKASKGRYNEDLCIDGPDNDLKRGGNV